MATKLPTTSLHVATASLRKKICSSSLSVRWNTIQSVTDALTCPTCQQDDVPRFLLFAPVIKTFRGGEETFTSTRGALTRIDCIAAPAEMLPWLNLCRVLLTTGIRLQVVKSIHRHDHSPVTAVFQECSRQKRETERGANMVSRGHQRMLDCWKEKTRSDRRCRAGA